MLYLPCMIHMALADFCPTCRHLATLARVSLHDEQLQWGCCQDWQRLSSEVFFLKLGKICVGSEDRQGVSICLRGQLPLLRPGPPSSLDQAWYVMQVQAAAQKLQDLEQKLQQGERNKGGSSSSSPLVQQRLASLARERDDALTRLDLVSGALLALKKQSQCCKASFNTSSWLSQACLWLKPRYRERLPCLLCLLYTAACWSIQRRWNIALGTRQTRLMLTGRQVCRERGGGGM